MIFLFSIVLYQKCYLTFICWNFSIKICMMFYLWLINPLGKMLCLSYDMPKTLEIKLQVFNIYLASQNKFVELNLHSPMNMRAAIIHQSLEVYISSFWLLLLKHSFAKKTPIKNDGFWDGQDRRNKREFLATLDQRTLLSRREARNISRSRILFTRFMFTFDSYQIKRSVFIRLLAIESLLKILFSSLENSWMFDQK